MDIEVSIIVPVYNAEICLRRCVDSLLKQSFPNFELLLIDDGSTDSSLNICREYERLDQRVRVFYQRNRGVSFARNLGIEHTKGKWIAFCDSDDYVDDNWLSLLLNNVEDNQLVVQGMIVHRDNEIWNSSVEYTGEKGKGLIALYNKHIVGYLFVKLFREDIIKNNNLLFNESFRFREDEDFVLRYLQYVSKMKSFCAGAYHYIMPDLSTKYLSVETFYCSLSMYISVRNILGTEHKVTRLYLLELTNSLFDSYTKQKKDTKQKFQLYRKNVKTEFYKIKEISILSKIIYLLGGGLAHYLYTLKSKI